MNDDYNNQQPQPPYQQYQTTYQQPQDQQLSPYTPVQYGAYYVPGSGLGTASLVCGILSLILPFVSLILGIIAIATGGSAKKKGYMGGKATAGIVMGIIGTAWNALLLFSSLIGLFSLI